MVSCEPWLTVFARSECLERGVDFQDRVKVGIETVQASLKRDTIIQDGRQITFYQVATKISRIYGLKAMIRKVSCNFS